MLSSTILIGPLPTRAVLSWLACASTIMVTLAHYMVKVFEDMGEGNLSEGIRMLHKERVADFGMTGAPPPGWTRSTIWYTRSANCVSRTPCATSHQPQGRSTWG